MWAGDRRNCGKPSGLQYGCAYSNPTQKGEKERSTGELMAVVYIPKLEFKIKACNTCGKEIPKGDPLSKEIVARAFGQEAVGLEAPAFAGLIEETFRQLWSEVAMVKIQKQKEENIDRVKR